MRFPTAANTERERERVDQCTYHLRRTHTLHEVHCTDMYVHTLRVCVSVCATHLEGTSSSSVAAVAVAALISMRSPPIVYCVAEREKVY